MFIGIPFSPPYRRLLDLLLEAGSKKQCLSQIVVCKNYKLLLNLGIVILVDFRNSDIDL